jgi:hypothetical protein
MDDHGAPESTEPFGCLLAWRTGAGALMVGNFAA